MRMYMVLRNSEYKYTYLVIYSKQTVSPVNKLVFIKYDFRQIITLFGRHIPIIIHLVFIFYLISETF